ncbi:MAG: serine/threonine protein kinase [Labilithrix sp.]|nr:serine/threonine protein kinase [Labilithrix sp.]
MSEPSDTLPSSARYRIASCIATGGMGSVYVGIQRGAAGFKRPVAIKRAHPHLLGDPELRAAILTEARIASAVRHPNVVSVDDVEETDGELLLVMDYVEGTSLAHLLATTGALALPIAVRIGLDACAALHAIHLARNEDGEALGLVHRDVSPQNILIDTDGLARLTDFGIAKTNHRDDVEVKEYEPPGKLGYMAPEYLKGARFSAQSDMFALGVVLWETVTGKNLFRGASPAESLRLTLDAAVPSAASVNGAVPSALDAVIARCLARLPEDRFATIRELQGALEAALPGAASRDDVADLVLQVAGPAIAEQRKAINVARVSVRPAREYPQFDLDEDAVILDRLAMPPAVTIEEPERLSFTTIDTCGYDPRADRGSCIARRRPREVMMPPGPRAKRARAWMAVGASVVTFVMSATALVVDLALDPDVRTSSVGPAAASLAAPAAEPGTSEVEVTSGEIETQGAREPAASLATEAPAQSDGN